MGWERELDAVRGWMDDTDRIALEHFRIGVPWQLKADGTPVTAADRGVEETIRRRIEEEFPADAIVGEETGESGGGARRWIIDPIDGTKNYARGVPVFATLVALEADGELVVGAVSAPALHARWWATKGGGAHRDDGPIRVSSVATLDEADVVTGSLKYADAPERAERALELIRRARRQRGFGDFWGHVLVAQGSADVMVELADLKIWDIAAPKIVVEEAGGRVSTTDGDPRLQPGGVVTTNGRLHDEVLGLLR